MNQYPTNSAELFVASTFSASKWNIYFPQHDDGFDFIVSKNIKDTEIIRPVQVKGKYATKGKTNKTTYGYTGALTKTHEEMVLAIPYYPSNERLRPMIIAYMPMAMIKNINSKGTFKSKPAQYKNGIPVTRPLYNKFFDAEGLKLLEKNNWHNMTAV